LKKKKNTSEKLIELRKSNKGRAGWENSLNELVNNHTIPGNSNFNNSRYVQEQIKSNGANGEKFIKIGSIINNYEKNKGNNI
jgi:hypothetical protein